MVQQNNVSEVFNEQRSFDRKSFQRHIRTNNIVNSTILLLHIKISDSFKIILFRRHKVLEFFFGL